MTPLPPFSRPLATVQDIARWLGLPASAGAKAIASRFGQATNFDALLEIESRRPEIRRAEEWEVRVIQTTPRCRVELRDGRRGNWTRTGENVPQTVLDFLDARIGRDGLLETTRSWKAWQKMGWARGYGRRLKSRHGEIVARVEIANVVRETGSILYEIRLDPIGAPDPDLAVPVRIALPCKASDIERAISRVREGFGNGLKTA